MNRHGFAEQATSGFHPSGICKAVRLYLSAVSEIGVQACAWESPCA